MIKLAKPSSWPNPKPNRGPDPQRIIAMLKKAEELTSPSGEDLMAMDDDERQRRDSEANSNYMGAVDLIQKLTQLSRSTIDRILGIPSTSEGLADFETECTKLGITLQIFFLFFTGNVMTNDQKPFKAAGIRGVHIQARMIREALEKELGMD